MNLLRWQIKGKNGYFTNYTQNKLFIIMKELAKEHFQMYIKSIMVRLQLK